MAAFASAPPDPLNPPTDPQAALIQAVQAGDAAAAAGLLQRWVHRRGVASLEPLVARVGELQGPEAADWLCRQFDRPAAASTAPDTPAATVAEPAAAAAPEPMPDPVAALEPPEDAESLPVGAGPGQPAEPPLPVAQDQPAGPAAPEVPPLTFELPSFELPPLDPPAPAAAEVPAAETPELPAAEAEPAPVPEAGSALPPLPQEWSLDLEAAFPPLGTAPRSTAVPADAVPADADAAEADSPPSRRRGGAFARMKSMVRGALEEARDVLHRFEAAELDDEEMEESDLEAEEPAPQPASPVQSAPPEIPSFLAEGAAAAGPDRAPGTAAPAPSALPDLRGWLPEAEDELPRAS